VLLRCSGGFSSGDKKKKKIPIDHCRSLFAFPPAPMNIPSAVPLASHPGRFPIIRLIKIILEPVVLPHPSTPSFLSAIREEHFVELSGAPKGHVLLPLRELQPPQKKLPGARKNPSAFCLPPSGFPPWRFTGTLSLTPEAMQQKL